jgi:DNA polymerase
VRAELGDCRRCKLHGGRTQIVFGVGNPRAELVFVGEAPGADEDAQGEPFVGRAGQLLTKIIEAMGMTRGDVYICNILKCRPPNNRTPEADEILACSPFLLGQLRAIQPRFICALGGPAAQTLLQTKEGITKLRGRFHDFHGIPLLPTFHPAYLLRNPYEKKTVWEDMKLLLRHMGRPIP